MAIPRSVPSDPMDSETAEGIREAATSTSTREPAMNAQEQKVMEQALEALSKSDDFLFDWHENESDNEADAYAIARQLNEKAITAIKETLAQQSNEQVEPVACVAEVSTFDGYLKKEVAWNKRVDSFAVGTKFFAHPPVPIATLTQQELLTAQPKQEPNKDGSPCPEFWDWLPKAYNFEGDGNFTKYNMEVAFLAGKQAAQPKEPEQEPVAWITQNGKGWLRWHKPEDNNKDSVPLYTTQPKRKPLTDEEIDAIDAEVAKSGYCQMKFARAIEAAHGIGSETTLVKE